MHEQRFHAITYQNNSPPNISSSGDLSGGPLQDGNMNSLLKVNTKDKFYQVC